MELTPSVPPSCAQHLRGHGRAADDTTFGVQILADVYVAFQFRWNEVTWNPLAGRLTGTTLPRNGRRQHKNGRVA